MRLLPLGAACALLAVIPAPAAAQNIFGTILGTVRDASGAIVIKADVVATAVETGQAYRSQTNESGYYEFSYLKPARYTVRVSATGFQTSERTDIGLQVEDRVRVDFKLQLGEVTASVSVSGEAPLIQSESASLGQVVTERTVREMPVLGRNVFELAGLAAGVQVNPVAEKKVLAKGGFDTSDIAINGGRIRTNEYLLDGVTVLLPENNNPAIGPTPEGTQEFKVQTGNSGAQFGRTGGGVVNVVTKGGTNEFHGTGWWFFRNARLAANEFFSNARGQALGAADYNYFGGTIGGPIKKNRTFFFAEYQQYRERIAGAGGALTFPTEEQRRGDFSATRVNNNTAAGQPVVIYDPFTTRPGPGGAGFVRDVFPGNRIPANRIDRVASRVITHIPLPNRPGEGPARLFNFAYDNNESNTNDQGSMRVDHRFSDRHSIFTRFTRSVTRIFSSPILGTIADPGADSQVQGFLNGVINGTYVFSPTRMINYRYGATRKLQDATPYYFGQIKLNDLGFPSYVSAASQLEAFPQMSFSGYDSIGTGPGTLRGNDIHTWVADFTEIRGRHSLKFGADTRVYNQTPFRSTASSGIYTFNNSFTQGPDPLRAARGAGDGFASFLTGYGTGNIQYSPAFAIRNGFVAVYAHDDIRAGRLTINVGLRWEWEQPRTERYNRFGNFDFDREFPGLRGVRGVLTQAGTEHYPRGQFETSLRNFAPQFGLAYRLGANTALRAGYGIVFSPRIGYTATRNYGASGAELQTQWVSSLDGVTPLSPISDPYPNGIFVQSGSEADRRLLGQALTITDRNSRNNTYSQQWSASLQHSVRGNWIFEAAYSASRGIRLPIAVQFNQVHPQFMSLGSQLNQQVPNPFFGLASTGPLANRTITRAQSLRPYPHYLNISTFIQNGAYSQYHGLHLTAEKRFSQGYNLLLAYTTGKTIDNGAGRIIDVVGLQPPIQNQYDLRAEKSLSQQDVAQRFVVSHTWDLPFGRGKAIGGGASRLVDSFIGGWSASGNMTFHSGYPVGLSSIGNSGVFSAVLRPNSVGRSAKLSGDPHDRLGRFFDPDAFTVPAPFTFGNVSRALPDVRTPDRRNYNLAVSKKIAVTERISALLRGEAYNLTNTPFFGLPGMQVGSNTLGVISSATNARTVQISGKVIF